MPYRLPFTPEVRPSPFGGNYRLELPHLLVLAIPYKTLFWRSCTIIDVKTKQKGATFLSNSFFYAWLAMQKLKTTEKNLLWGYFPVAVPSVCLRFPKALYS